MSEEERVKMPPVPKANLYLPIAFWSEILVHLDTKVHTIASQYGFGEVEMVIKIHKEKVFEVSFKDHVRVRGLVEKAGRQGDSSVSEENSKVA